MSEEIKPKVLYKITAYDSDYIKEVPDKVRTIGGTIDYYYDFKKHRYLSQFISDDFDIYDELQKLQQENQQLKEVLDELNQDKVYWINKCANAETVLDEIREYINNTEYYTSAIKYLKDSTIGEDLLQILDKVKE